MREILGKALGLLFVVLFVAGVIAFIVYLQTDPGLCDALGFPVCTGSPPD